MVGRMMFLAMLCASAQAQAFTRGANEYPIEAPNQAPLVESKLFTVNEVQDAKKSMLPEANIVVGIMSAPQNYEQREAVRASWMQFTSLTDPKLNNLSVEDKRLIIIRFIIGQPTSGSLDTVVAKESLKYHDIVRVPIVESYFNLTLKTGEFFKWAENAYNFKWAMKCDDDSFVRVDLLLQELQKQSASRLYMGKMWTGTPVDRRIDDHTPWKQHHTFAAGAGYVVSSELVSYLVRNYDNLYKFPLEDVAVGSWLSALNITYIDHPHFHSLPEGCDRDMIVQNPADVTVMRETFFNAVKGIPCHVQPDPFDPKTKNITDHVLLELGIPKTKAPRPQVAGVQNLVQLPTESLPTMTDGGMNGAPGMMGGKMSDGEDEEADEPNGDVDGGMEPSAMNSNMPTSESLMHMNAKLEASADGLAQAAAAAMDRMNEKKPVQDFNDLA